MKIKKSDLLNMIQEQNDVIAKLIRQVNCHHEDTIRIESVIEPKPQLKQLDQSVFDGEPEQIKWAVVTIEGAVLKFELEPVVKDGLWYWTHSNGCRQHSPIGQYDASNWQNSLIERENKELLEVDLNSELTGSELCKAMLARGDKYVMCRVNDDNNIQVISGWTCYGFTSTTNKYCLFKTPIPINNQGEPLTAADVGL